MGDSNSKGIKNKSGKSRSYFNSLIKSPSHGGWKRHISHTEKFHRFNNAEGIVRGGVTVSYTHLRAHET